MGLVLDGLRNCGKALCGIALACALYVGLQALIAFWGTLPTPGETVATLEELVSRKTTELEAVRNEVAAVVGELAHLDRRIRELESSRPQWVTLWPPGTHFSDRASHDAKTASLKAARATAEMTRESLWRARETLELEIQRLREQLENFLATPMGRVLVIARNHWFAGALLGIGVLVVPMLTRVGWFYVVAPVASSAAPVRLAQSSQRVGLISQPMLRCSAATKKLDLVIAPNESLFVRAACLKSYAATTRKRTQIAWKMDSPFISYSAGLWELTRVDGGADGAGVSLWSGEDADRQLVCLELQDHPGLVFRPRHLVGLIHEPEGLRLRKQWRLGHLHAWCTLQLRYIVLEGTGRAVFWALGGIEALSPGGGKQCVAQDSVAGFDSRLGYSVRRNETFWHYLRGKEPLFDDCFEGYEQYLVSVASEQNRGVVGVDTWLERLFSLVGKVFGF